jgi:MtN3 and saliva related transmembrane protein
MLTSIIGYTAALVTTFCLVPQLYKIIKDKNIEGVSVTTYCILLTGQILWIIYGLLVDDKIVISANFVSGLLSLLIIVFFNVYKKKDEITSVFQRPIQQRTNAIVSLSN